MNTTYSTFPKGDKPKNAPNVSSIPCEGCGRVASFQMSMMMTSWNAVVENLVSFHPDICITVLIDASKRIVIGYYLAMFWW